mmetsp:Transcript_9002/g.19592  ORF Transcript_9002/g.19592 Transcript_9002/m.19592 type:complete len:371 (-) Transcript_9002:19-1131(-)
MRLLVVEIVGVVDLAGGPHANVCRVVDLGCDPLALVLRVVDLWSLPLATAGGLAIRVGHHRRLKVAVLVGVPVVRGRDLGVWDLEGRVVEPRFRLGGLWVGDLPRSLLVPVVGLGGLRVVDLGSVDPISWLAVLRIVNLLRRVHARLEVGGREQVCLLDLHVVDQDPHRVVRTDDGCVQVGLANTELRRRRRRKVLLLVLAGDGRLVADDEMHLVGATALVWPEHDRVWGSVGKTIGTQLFRRREQLQVRATTLERRLHLQLILHDEARSLWVQWCGEHRRHRVLLCLVANNEAHVARDPLRLSIRFMLPRASEFSILRDNPATRPISVKRLEEEALLHRREGLCSGERCRCCECENADVSHLGVGRSED